MFIRYKKSKNQKLVRVQIVETFKEGKKTIQKILAHLGIAHDENELAELSRLAIFEMEVLRSKRSKGTLFDATDELLEQFDAKLNEGKIETSAISAEKVVIDGPETVFKSLFDDIGLGDLLPGVSQEVLSSVIAQRCEEPDSKLAISEKLNVKSENRSFSEDSIYRMMDKLALNIDKMKQIVRGNTLRIEGAEIDVAFYDCTTLYFESATDDGFRKFGFSKDSKHHQTQVVLALATTENGMPLDYELFSGNTAEVTTLLSCLNRWKNLFKIKAITFVADRGLFSINNLVEIRKAGYDFVVAFPLRKMNAENKNLVLQSFDRIDVAPGNKKEPPIKGIKIEHVLTQKIKNKATGFKEEFTVTGKLHIDHCPERAGKDQYDRDQLVTKILKKLGDDSSDQKKLVSNAGYKKYVNCAEGKMSLNTSKINADAQWDGLHGIYTSLDLTNEEVRSRYKRLWVIEQTFRISKSDLKVRPMFHWKQRRIEAHIGICYISLAIVRTIELKLKQTGIKISFKKFNQLLSKVGYCVVSDATNGASYKLPIKISAETKAILSSLGISYRTSASKI
ncbi:MAG: IS1634 family transposase [Bacteroidota bacterium]